MVFYVKSDYMQWQSETDQRALMSDGDMWQVRLNDCPCVFKYSSRRVESSLVTECNNEWPTYSGILKYPFCLMIALWRRWRTSVSHKVILDKETNCLPAINRTPSYSPATVLVRWPIRENKPYYSVAFFLYF